MEQREGLKGTWLSAYTAKQSCETIHLRQWVDLYEHLCLKGFSSLDSAQMPADEIPREPSIVMRHSGMVTKYNFINY